MSGSRFLRCGEASQQRQGRFDIGAGGVGRARAQPDPRRDHSRECVRQQLREGLQVEAVEGRHLLDKRDGFRIKHCRAVP